MKQSDPGSPGEKRKNVGKILPGVWCAVFAVICWVFTSSDGLIDAHPVAFLLCAACLIGGIVVIWLSSRAEEKAKREKMVESGLIPPETDEARIAREKLARTRGLVTAGIILSNLGLSIGLVFAVILFTRASEIDGAIWKGVLSAAAFLAFSALRVWLVKLDRKLNRGNRG